MEGSLPGIGLMPETPAALTNPADPAATPGLFASLMGRSVGQPAAAPAGRDLPPTGAVLPPSAALFRSVAGTGEADLPADVSAAPGHPLIPALPGTAAAAGDGTGLPASIIEPAPLAGSVIARTPGADAESVAATGTGSAYDVGGVQRPAAAAAEVVEMVRQLERGIPAQPGAGVSDVATSLSPGAKPETAPVSPASHPDPGHLPERPARLVSPPLTATQPVHGDRIGPAPATASPAGLTPAPAIQGGIVTQSIRQWAPDPAAASPDGPELPDLPFESIRVTVREAGGERLLPNREPGFQLPGPRQPLGDPQWARSLGERLAVVVRGEHQTARMSLNPAHLGPIDIQLRLQDDQAQLWLTAQHPQAREALESAMPRLREMFAQQGIDLSQQGSGQPGERGTDERSGGPTVSMGTDPGADEPESTSRSGSGPARVRSETGLFDEYA